MEQNTHSTEQIQAVVITPEELLHHWQGHRHLTRQVIEAFPEDKLFDYSIGGMRPFSELAMEMIRLAGPGIAGILTNEWEKLDEAPSAITTRQALLELWDQTTEQINATWPQIEPQRFHETVVAFDQYEETVFGTIFYFIDNEIHHRGQGYVYLRSLGVEPPPFWARA